MIGPSWYAAFLLIASGGVACLAYSVVALFAPEWAAMGQRAAGRSAKNWVRKSPGLKKRP